MSGPKVVIVADDLTGALDVAGPFATRGHATWVAVDHRQVDAAQFAGAQVLSVNAASRHLPSPLAASLVEETIERLCPPGTEILIKKIDSTLRGNVAAETLAAMHAAHRPNAIVIPAFPAQGRTVARAMVHVLGVPLPQTSFARDALSPPPRDPLDQVFQTAASNAVVCAVPPHGPFALSAPGAQPRIYVVDSATDADLRTTVEALGERLRHCVLVGSAGIAAAVAQVCMGDRPHPPLPQVGGDVLVVVGSRAEQSAVQVEMLEKQPDVGVFTAPNGQLPDAQIMSDRRPVAVLRAVAAPNRAVADASDVARMLAQDALRVLQARRVEALLATGGDTAIAILHCLGVAALQVMGDLLPGVPYARLQLAGRPIWLITKAGGFGTPQTMREVVTRLRAAPGN
jgi:D-threonate/D-erythronate kinase